jgi:hypothetical protein
MTYRTSFHIVSDQPANGGRYYLCKDDFLRSFISCCGSQDDTLVYRRLSAARKRLAKIQKFSALRRADSFILATTGQADGTVVEVKITA